MRPTLLQFRDPAGRTPEFRINNVTHSYQRLSYAAKNEALQDLAGGDATALGAKSPAGSASPPRNKFGQNFSRADRFNHDERFYCNLSGQSVHVGPGAYESAESLKKLLAQPCSALMKPSSQLGAKESKMGCYVMIGHSLKFEPGLLKYIKDHEVRYSKTKATQKDIFQQHGGDQGAPKSLSLALDLSDPTYLKKLKKMSKARRNLLRTQHGPAPQNSSSQGPGVSSSTDFMKKRKESRSQKKTAAESACIEQIVKLYENCPESTVSGAIAKHYKSTPFSPPKSGAAIVDPKVDGSRQAEKPKIKTKRPLKRIDLTHGAAYSRQADAVESEAANIEDMLQESLHKKDNKKEEVTEVNQLSAPEEQQQQYESPAHSPSNAHTVAANNFSDVEVMLKPSKNQESKPLLQDAGKLGDRRQSKLINYETEAESKQASNKIKSGSPIVLEESDDMKVIYIKKPSPERHRQRLQRNMSSLSASTSAFRKSLNSAFHNYGRLSSSKNPMNSKNETSNEQINNHFNEALENDHALKDIVVQAESTKTQKGHSSQRPLSQHHARPQGPSSAQMARKRDSRSRLQQNYTTQNYDANFSSDNNTTYHQLQAPADVPAFSRPQTSASSNAVRASRASRSRFHLAHRSSAIAVKVPQNIMKKISTRFSSNVSSGGNSKTANIRQMAQSKQEQTPLERIANEIDLHYGEIELRKREQQRREQVYLLEEQARNLNQQEDYDFKRDPIKDYQKRKLSKKKRQQKKAALMQAEEQSEPLMDYLSVRNRRHKVSKDHDLNTLFNSLGNRLRSNSNPRRNDSKRSPGGRKYRSSQPNNYLSSNTDAQVINDIQIQMLQSQPNQRAAGQEGHLGENKKTDLSGFAAAQFEPSPRDRSRELDDYGPAGQLFPAASPKRATQQSGAPRDSNVDSNIASQLDNHLFGYSESTNQLSTFMNKRESLPGQQSQISQTQNPIKPPDLRAGGAADQQEVKQVSEVEAAAAVNSGTPGQPAIESSTSSPAAVPPHRSEASNRQENVPHLVPHDAQRSEDDLQRATEEPEQQDKDASESKDRGLVIDPQQRGNAGAILAVTDSLPSHQPISSYEFALDSAQEQVVANNLSILSAKMQTTDQDPKAVEVETKTIMNALGKAILEHFRRKKAEAQRKDGEWQQQTFNQSGTKSFKERQLDKPLLVKDIRTRMGQEVVRLMQKQTTRAEPQVTKDDKQEALEKKVKELLGTEILKVVKQRRMADRQQEKSGQKYGTKSRVSASRLTDATKQIPEHDPVIAELDDDLNLSYVDDAIIDLSELERLINRDEQTAPRPSSSNIREGARQAIVDVEKAVDALAEFEDLNESDIQDHVRQDSIRRHRKSCDMGDIGRTSPQFFGKASQDQEYDDKLEIQIKISNASERPGAAAQRRQSPQDKGKGSHGKKRNVPLPGLALKQRDSQIKKSGALSHYLPAKKASKMATQHLGSMLTPKCGKSSVGDGVNDLESVGMAFLHQSHHVPPSYYSKSKSKNQGEPSLMNYTQHNRFSKEIVEDEAHRSLRVQHIDINNDISEVIEQRNFSSDKYRESYSRSKSKLHAFQAHVEEQEHAIDESGSFSHTIKADDPDAVIDSGKDGRKLVDLSSATGASVTGILETGLGGGTGTHSAANL